MNGEELRFVVFAELKIGGENEKHYSLSPGDKLKKEILRAMMPYMKEAMEKYEPVYSNDTLPVLINIRDLLECLILQNSMMMTDKQFKDFQEQLDDLKTLQS